MKLVSCHILGFGKFVNASFDLSGELVIFKENNGWGKTTLADFIECMFFGLENSRSRSVAENYRLKYAPWSGGGFGGSLTFFFQGQTYRIERIFGRTAGADVVKIYNQNHAPCYEFGEKGERIGEMLFGVERESYRKIAYIPQGETRENGFPESLKARLIALLGDTQANGESQGALERLEAAERALRAKRKPAKGKIDLLDEKIESLSRAVEEGKAAKTRAVETQAQAQGLKERIHFLTSECERISNSLSAGVRERESELRGKLLEREEELSALRAFFAETDVETLNVAGLENAVKEFYELKEKTDALKSETVAVEEENREIERLKMQISAKEQALETYTLLLQEKEETTGAGLRSKKKRAKKEKKNDRGALALVLGFAGLILGISLWKSQQSLATLLIVIGGGAAILGMLPILFKSGKKETEKAGKESLKKRIAQTEKELEDLKFELSALLQTAQKKSAEAQEILEKTERRLAALEKGIIEFCAHFPLPQTYDYRAVLQILKEKKGAYERCLKKTEEYRKNQAAHSQGLPQDGERERLTAQKRSLEQERENCLDARAKALAELSRWERLERDSELYLEELERLQAEKKRLEKRLLAVQTAREILLRARENTASRYLGSVENICARYARILGDESLSKKLRLLSGGGVVVEENGVFKGAEYYSAGTRELLDFCIRLALAETIFTREKPALILDDPFVNLDDEKTESAKRLVKELSKTHQVLYFTCKTERILQ